MESPASNIVFQDGCQSSIVNSIIVFFQVYGPSMVFILTCLIAALTFLRFNEKIRGYISYLTVFLSFAALEAEYMSVDFGFHLQRQMEIVRFFVTLVSLAAGLAFYMHIVTKNGHRVIVKSLLIVLAPVAVLLCFYAVIHIVEFCPHLRGILFEPLPAGHIPDEFAPPS